MATAVTIAPTPILAFFNNQGQPCVGGSVLTQVGGVNTATYQDSAGTIPLPNPIPLNNRGEISNAAGVSCQLFLISGVAYVFTLLDANGNQLNQANYVTPPASSGSLTAFITLLNGQTGSFQVGFIGALPGAAARTSQSKMRDIISVADYPGWDPTGATDQTAVFNLATQSTAAFSAALAYDIYTPSATLLVNGSVFVRSGQTLRGAGHGTFIVCTGTPASTPNFVLGSSSTGADGSGSPVEIRDFRTIGGGGTAGVIKSIQAGFTIADVFMTAPGIGIDCQGADGLIYGVEIDQALSGMSIGGGNIEITNCNFYLANYAITLVTGVHDVAISNCEFEYSQYAAILYPTGGTAIRGITLSGCNFTMNAQFSTFLGFIVMQSSNSEVQATGCSFRNMYQWAINHNTGTGNQFLFSGCIFDGTPTTTGYTSSTTAKVLNTVAAGLSTYDFEGCQYRNLLGEIATLTNGISNLTFNGGLVVNCPVTRFSMAALTDWPKITVKGVKGFAFIANTGAAQAIVLPYWGPSCVWKVSVKGNPLTGSSGFYAAAEEAAYAVTYQYNGTAQFTYVDKMPIWATPNRTIPGQLGAVVCFGTAPGGATSQAGIVQTGTICISVATTTAANFDWYAETGT